MPHADRHNNLIGRDPPTQIPCFVAIADEIIELRDGSRVRSLPKITKENLMTDRSSKLLSL